MTSIDYFILLIYLIATLGIGVFYSKKQRKKIDFFLAGKSMHWIPIGISVMVTAFSAINYTAFSSEISTHGLYVLLCIPVFIIVAWPIKKIFIPFFYDLNLYSAYEYLEKRFDKKVRSLASLLFIIWRILWAATLIYVPAKVLSSITGTSVQFLIIITGIIATFYTLLGGMKAVMWTDVMQFFIFFFGIIFGLLTMIQKFPNGLTEIFRINYSDGILMPFFPFDHQIFSFNPTIRITLWSSLIGVLTAFLTRYGADQVIIQRYFTAKSIQNIQKGFNLNIIAAIISLILLTFLGLSIHAFVSYSEIIQQSSVPINHFSLFLKSLPPGITGLIVAGLFAATMSSADSGINSCCTAFYHDLLFSKDSEHTDFIQIRIITLFFGFIIILLALNIGKFGSIFEIANKIVNGFGSPLLALFILGMFSKRANSRGVFWGTILGATWSAIITLTVKNLALHYYAFVNFAGTIVICYLLSIIENYFYTKPLPEKLTWLWDKKPNNSHKKH